MPSSTFLTTLGIGNELITICEGFFFQITAPHSDENMYHTIANTVVPTYHPIANGIVPDCYPICYRLGQSYWLLRSNLIKKKYHGGLCLIRIRKRHKRVNYQNFKLPKRDLVSQDGI